MKSVLLGTCAWLGDWRELRIALVSISHLNVLLLRFFGCQLDVALFYYRLNWANRRADLLLDLNLQQLRKLDFILMGALCDFSE